MSHYRWIQIAIEVKMKLPTLQIKPYVVIFKRLGRKNQSEPLTSQHLTKLGSLMASVDLAALTRSPWRAFAYSEL